MAAATAVRRLELERAEKRGWGGERPQPAAWVRASALPERDAVGGELGRDQHRVPKVHVADVVVEDRDVERVEHRENLQGGG